MCLATVYKEEDNSVIFKNVSRIDVDGNKLILRARGRGQYSHGRSGEQYRETAV